MAGRNSKDEVRKRNCRLETFFKHSLNFDEYERIRSHESCVVCSEKETRAFKFIALDDCWIYLTENPPKKLNRIIHLRDVLSVRMESDYPDFLAGAERENTQHMTINYLTDEKPKSRAKPKSNDKSAKEAATDKNDKPTESARSQLQQQPNEDGKSLSARSKEKPRNPDALSVTARWTTMRGPLTARLTSRKVTFSHDSSSAIELNTLSNGYASADEITPISASRDTSVDDNGQKQLKTKKKKKKQSGNESENRSDGERLGSSLDAGVLRDALNSRSSGPVSARDHNESANSAEANSSGSTPLNRSVRLALNDSAVEDNSNDADRPFVPPLDLNDVTNTPRSILRTSLTQSQRLDLKSHEILYSATLHVYLLNRASCFMTLVSSAWNSSLIKCTLEEDHDLMFQRELFPPKLPSEKLEVRFNQLKGDLMNPNNSLEDNFSYLHELRDGTERNFVLKRFFWKCSETFPFLVNQLAINLPSSKRTADDNNRADQIEYVILIMETLSTMLRESEIFTTRMPILRDHGGQTLEQLVLFTASTVQGLDQDADKELLNEFTDKSAWLLYELIRVAEQAAWCDVPESFFKVLWIAQVLRKLEATELSRFTERLVRRAIVIISPVERKTFRFTRLSLAGLDLTPQEAVFTHYLFYVLNTLTFNSTSILRIVQEKFHEEFKYYIQLPVHKLPPHYTISAPTQRLIELVVRRVTGNDVIVNNGTRPMTARNTQRSEASIS